eukprot:CAMPEP_0170644702 /NCGR_PEP_ID=MMETSP0224-20130122/42638_1 /TAXON_ID=285029 /ORGANISM="Togula jolla, Strain CCCM 725" /LENGTH=73 /DNA_ID=CAMNT_0010975771 /DNA_START=93 /DNA_END=314 /DNA_ORIENTATION=-
MQFQLLVKEKDFSAVSRITSLMIISTFVPVQVTITCIQESRAVKVGAAQVLRDACREMAEVREYCERVERVGA